MNFSKILRDKAMQVKILSAVQVASQKVDNKPSLSTFSLYLARFR